MFLDVLLRFRLEAWRLEAWNAHSRTQIFPHDRISSLNGLPCHTEELLRLCAKDRPQDVQLRIDRPERRILYLQRLATLSLGAQGFEGPSLRDLNRS